MAKLETLIDTFHNASLNAALWTQSTAGSATFTYNSGVSGNGQVNFPVSTTATTIGTLTSVSAYDLTNSYARMHVKAVPTAASAADAELRLGTAANNYIRWVQEGGTLFAQYNVVGTKSTPFSVAYSSTTHAWWRIREGTGDGAGGTAGNIYWDTAPDSSGSPGVWVQRATVADPITVTALSAIIQGNGTTTASSPGTYSWDNFNTQAGVSPSSSASPSISPSASRSPSSSLSPSSSSSPSISPSASISPSSSLSPSSSISASISPSSSASPSSSIPVGNFITDAKNSFGVQTNQTVNRSGMF